MSIKARLEDWNNEEGLKKIEEWIAKGLTVKDVAKNMGVSRSTLYSWKDKDSDILNALRAGREVQNEIIEGSLFKRATGYNTEEFEYKYDDFGNKVPTKSRLRHIPADPTVLMFVAENISEGKWKRKLEVTEEGTYTITEIVNDIKE